MVRMYRYWCFSFHKFNCSSSILIRLGMEICIMWSICTNLVLTASTEGRPGAVSRSRSSSFRGHPKELAVSPSRTPGLRPIPIRGPVRSHIFPICIANATSTLNISSRRGQSNYGTYSFWSVLRALSDIYLHTQISLVLVGITMRFCHRDGAIFVRCLRVLNVSCLRAAACLRCPQPRTSTLETFWIITDS